MLDFEAVNQNSLTFSQLVEGLDVADLHRLTDEMVDAMLGIIAGAVDADVPFVPQDPAANDRFASSTEEEHIAWTLGHVVVHCTASSEEAAALATDLARGLEIKGRSRYETPWREVTRISQLKERLEDSRRMRHAFLDAWPAPPHFETLYTPNWGNLAPMNAIGRFVLGLSHDHAHLNQLREIMRQARAARGVSQ